MGKRNEGDFGGVEVDAGRKLTERAKRFDKAMEGQARDWFVAATSVSDGIWKIPDDLRVAETVGHCSL